MNYVPSFQPDPTVTKYVQSNDEAVLFVPSPEYGFTWAMLVRARLTAVGDVIGHGVRITSHGLLDPDS